MDDKLIEQRKDFRPNHINQPLSSLAPPPHLRTHNTKKTRKTVDSRRGSRTKKTIYYDRDYIQERVHVGAALYGKDQNSAEMITPRILRAKNDVNNCETVGLIDLFNLFQVMTKAKREVSIDFALQNPRVVRRHCINPPVLVGKMGILFFLLLRCFVSSFWDLEGALPNQARACNIGSSSFFQ